MLASYYLFLHFLADFILQPREMGRKKSKDSRYLLAHIAIIFSVFLVGTLSWKFALANALIHMIIDSVIWKCYASTVWKRRHKLFKNATKDDLERKFKFWEDHWFYATIGLDQFLHGATILILLEIL